MPRALKQKNRLFFNKSLLLAKKKKKKKLQRCMVDKGRVKFSCYLKTMASVYLAFNLEHVCPHCQALAQ